MIARGHPLTAHQINAHNVEINFPLGKLIIVVDSFCFHNLFPFCYDFHIIETTGTVTTVMFEASIKMAIGLFITVITSHYMSLL